jgi:hypothetical protein
MMTSNHSNGVRLDIRRHLIYSLSRMDASLPSAGFFHNHTETCRKDESQIPRRVAKSKNSLCSQLFCKGFSSNFRINHLPFSKFEKGNLFHVMTKGNGRFYSVKHISVSGDGLSNLHRSI